MTAARSTGGEIDGEPAAGAAFASRGAAAGTSAGELWGSSGTVATPQDMATASKMNVQGGGWRIFAMRARRRLHVKGLADRDGSIPLAPAAQILYSLGNAPERPDLRLQRRSLRH